MSVPHKGAAIAVLERGSDLNRKTGQFLGTVAVQDEPLSEKQRRWLDDLLNKHGLPALEDGGR